MSVVSGTAYGMPASRILRFARTSRCAIVAAGTRNARAISSVSRPPSVRSVSATCASSGKRRMAAGEDQPEAIVGDFVRVVVRLLDGPVEPRRAVRLELLLGPRPAPEAVDGLVPGGLDDPGARELRDAGGPPLVHGGRKGFLRRLFGHVEVADEPDQGGDDPAPIGAIDCVDRRRDVRDHNRW